MGTLKKALIYDPYLDTLGGGERYVLTFAKAIADNGYSVEVAWPYQETIQQAGERFNLDLSQLSANQNAFGTFAKGNIFNKYLLTKNYELIFWISDGSLPLLFGKRNLIHFQVPFKKIKGAFFKSLFIDQFIYNSKFTQSVLEKSLPKSKGVVLYPPVDIDKFKPGKKENLIIGVGRFDAPLNNKRQDILIEAFKKFHEIEPDYELVILGGLLGDETQIDHLKVQAQGLPIEFITNPNFKTLQDHYARAKFFWHAAGYGIDEDREPEKAEHFGITTVEALAAGCIPIVIAKGGQKEIIISEDFLCDNLEEIVSKTVKLINQPPQLKFDLQPFSLKTFDKTVSEIISK